MKDTLDTDIRTLKPMTAGPGCRNPVVNLADTCTVVYFVTVNYTSYFVTTLQLIPILYPLNRTGYAFVVHGFACLVCCLEDC